MGAKMFNQDWVRTKGHPIPHQMYYPRGYRALFLRCRNQFYFGNKFYFRVRTKRSLKNEEVLKLKKIHYRDKKTNLPEKSQKMSIYINSL